MPHKHSIRQFYNGGYYHLYNRGVAKQDIFLSERDYKVFLYYMKVFLLSPDDIDEDETFYQPRRKNFFGRLKLHSYCLMPNHFHLLMSQVEDNGVSEFMRALSNAYTRYFNQQYERVGCLFQGRYKAAWIDKQNYYLHISRYIHLNPLDIGQKPTEYDYSSLLYYLDNGPERPSWLDVETIRDAVGSANDYRAFITEDQEPDDLQELKIDN